MAHADLLVRSDALARTLRPELVIRIGGGLTSKRLAQWLDASGAETLLLSEDGRAVDPSHAAALLPGDLSHREPDLGHPGVHPPRAHHRAR